MGELSTGITLSINLVLVSWILTIVLVFTSAGKEISKIVLSKVSNAQISSMYGEFNGLNEYKGQLPATTVYAMVLRNQAQITTVTGTAMVKDNLGNNIAFTINNVEDLKKIFAYKVTCAIANDGDLFRVIITP